LRVVFAGTPPFAARALEAIVAAGHDVALVLTQPDRPAGRGLQMSPSAVAQCAAGHGLVVEKPASLKDPQAQLRLRELAPEVMVVAAYGLLLPQAVLDIPSRGCLNIHASLLPRWRGAAPIQRALLAGDETTGICIMQMEAGLDTGPVLLEKEMPIGPRDTTGSLLERLAGLGAECIVQALAELDSLQPRPQDDARATYAAKITKADARIDWSRSAAQIDRQVRAFNPTPGAEARMGEDLLKIWEARPVAGAGIPGSVIEASPARLVIACGEGSLQLLQLQRPGGRRMGAADFVRGKPLTADTHFS
jgi:methionyl-tRNA formyltransferase